MNNARDHTAHGIFSLKLGPTVHNIMSDPELVKNVMQQKESIVRFKPIAWTVMERVGTQANDPGTILTMYSSLAYHPA